MNGREMELLESLKCPVCIDYAEDPMECQHCSNIFCRQCLGIEGDKIKMKSCPMCRKEPSFKESAFAKRLLSSVPVECPNECGANITKNDLNAHLLKCPNKKYKCNVCDLNLKKEEFIGHVTTKHEDEIFTRFVKDEVTKTGRSTTNTLKDSIISVSNPLHYKSNSLDGGFNLINSDPVVNVSLINNPNPSPVNRPINQDNKQLLTNKSGNSVAMGENGKFYCGKKTGFKCGCCDGNCGPDNGCCCKDCMELNCRIRNLPFGMLVNNKGMSCKFTRNYFYCGAEYEKENKNIFQKVFKRKLKCEYPQDSCTDCAVLNRNMLNYFSKSEVSKIVSNK